MVPDLERPADGGAAHGAAVTIGAFDGVHLGHRRLVRELRREAAARGLRTVVVTFDRHPAAVVRPDSAPMLLTDLGQKVELLGATGVDEVMVLRFDEARAAEQAPDFVREVLVGALSARLVMVGADFHFGAGRRGNVALLRSMGEELGFDVIGVDLVPDPEGGEVVSSTRVRQLIAAGDVDEAVALLGRPHEVRGRVVAVEDAGGLVRLETPREIALPGAGSYRVAVCVEGGDAAHAGAWTEATASVTGTAGGAGRHAGVELRGAEAVAWQAGDHGRVAFLAAHPARVSD